MNKKTLYAYDEAPKSHTVVIPTFDMFLFFISWDMKVPVYLTFVSGTIYAGHPIYNSVLLQHQQRQQQREQLGLFLVDDA